MRHAVRVVGLTLLAAIGMMTAAVAHAEEMKEGSLRVEGKTLTFGEEAEWEATKSAPGKLIVPKLKIKIKCIETVVGGSISNYILNAKGEKELGLHTHGKFLALFHKCTVEEGGANCTIYPTRADLEAKTNAGLIHASALALWLVRLTGALDHIRIEGTNGLGNGQHANTFAVWYYGGLKCTLGEEAEVNGVGALMFSNATSQAREHTIEDITLGEEEALKNASMTDIGLKYNSEPTELEGGSATGSLIGVLADELFSLS